MFAEHAAYASVIKTLVFSLSQKIRSERASWLKLAGCLFCIDISIETSNCFYISCFHGWDVRALLTLSHCDLKLYIHSLYIFFFKSSSVC